MNEPVAVGHVTTIDLTLRFLLLAQLRRLEGEGFAVTAISAPGPWAEAGIDGMRHIPWRNATRSWHPFRDMRAAAELFRILRHERFDLVHTHNPKPGVLGRVAARLAGVPCVVNTVHGLYAAPEDRAIKKWSVIAAEKFAALFSDLEFYQSEEDLKWARSLGIVEAGRSVLLGNGTDVDYFDPARVSPHDLSELRRELGIPEGAPIVGTVGRLVAEKGYRELAVAARDVRAAVPEARFVAVGDSDAQKKDAILPDELTRDGTIIVTGWREDVRELLALMDVFVLASWREGVPRSAIEAAAMAKACVLTDVRGCREVVRDRDEGILVPPRDPKRLAGAILELLRNPEQRASMGAAARRSAVARFDERRVTDVVVEQYRKLLDRKGLISEELHDGIRIRRARAEDAPALANLHREQLPTSFLPKLGHGFLVKLHRALIKDHDAVVYVAEDRDEVIGFVSGVVSVNAFYRRFLTRHGLSALAGALPRLLRKETLRRTRETASYPRNATGAPDSELLVIAINDREQRGGIGRALVGRLLKGLGERGADAVKVVVAVDNHAANNFYERLGFRHHGRTFVHAREPSNVWVIECHSSALSPSPSS